MGEVLLQYVLESGMTRIALAKKAGYSKSAYNTHIKKRVLSLDILLKYGKALRHDFLTDFPHLIGNMLGEPAVDFDSLSTATTIEEAARQRDVWKTKYFELLEKYHQLKEEMDKLKKR